MAKAKKDKCSGFARKYILKKKDIKAKALKRIAKQTAKQRADKCAIRAKKYRNARNVDKQNARIIANNKRRRQTGMLRRLPANHKRSNGVHTWFREVTGKYPNFQKQ